MIMMIWFRLMMRLAQGICSSKQPIRLQFGLVQLDWFIGTAQGTTAWFDSFCFYEISGLLAVFNTILFLWDFYETKPISCFLKDHTKMRATYAIFLSYYSWFRIEYRLMFLSVHKGIRNPWFIAVSNGVVLYDHCSVSSSLIKGLSHWC